MVTFSNILIRIRSGLKGNEESMIIKVILGF
jgi:hypothetical protein